MMARIRWITLAVMVLTTTGMPATLWAQATADLEVGVFTGYNLIASNTELGNAFYSDNVPDSGFAVGARVGRRLFGPIAVEGELKLVPSKYVSDGKTALILGWRGNVLWVFDAMNGKVRPFLLVGAGGESLLSAKSGGARVGDISERDTDAALLAGAGASVAVADHVDLRGDLRYVGSAGRDATLAHNAEFLLGVTFRFGGTTGDKDSDGIPDALDKCPSEAEDVDGFEDDDGCPDPDNDKDGIPDAIDRCPLLAEDRDGWKDDDGCPDPDNDGDGIPDAKDKCPNEPEDMDGFQDDDGCPDLDNDGDGVPDSQDKCPTETETRNGFEDDDGCPDTMPEKVTQRFNGTIRGIQFETDSALILPVSYKLLDEAVTILKEYASVRIEITGHTDNTGDRLHNVKLSNDRAESVKAYFAQNGIQPARMVAKGYGDERPVASNATAKGKAENRRIEIRVLTE
jgi:outer membrane protein OmpA-like peptidoglycan-associated protein/opacity protein-like surface antigen